MSLRQLLIICATMILTCFDSLIAPADDSLEFPVSALRPVNDFSWSQLGVRILDPEGRAVEGALVRPCGLRAGTGVSVWEKAAWGGPPRTTSNAAGETDLFFPQSVYWGESKRVFQVSMMVSHTDFCTKTVPLTIPETDPPRITEVRLDRGVRLRIAGVEPGTDKPLSDCHLLLENGDTDEPEFVRQPDGWLLSNPIREDRRWFRVIRLLPGKPPQFSKPHAWDPNDPKPHEMRVEVRPGVRVIGKLSDDVIRPIKRGHVVVWCGSPARGETADNPQRRQAIWWTETVPIEDDGSFEFPSLPSGYLAQLFAIANDSISVQASDDAYQTCCTWFAERNRPRNPSLRYGQILRLAGLKSEVTLNMESAGQVRVKCVDRDGHPLRRMPVCSWPSQDVVGAEIGLLCGRRSSLILLRGINESQPSRDNPFFAFTNPEGEAVIGNLPSGSHWLFAGNDDWTNKDGQQFNAKPGIATVVELPMDRRP